MPRKLTRVNSIGVHFEDVYFEDGPDKGKVRGREWIARINMTIETELDGNLKKVIEVPVGEAEVIKFVNKVINKAKEIEGLEEE